MDFMQKLIKKLLKKNDKKTQKQNQSAAQPIPHMVTISTSLNENLQEIKRRLGNSSDLKIREIRIGKNKNINAAMVYIDGMADKHIIHEILESMMFHFNDSVLDTSATDQDLFSTNIIEIFPLTIGELTIIDTFDSLFVAIASGNTVLLIDGLAEAMNIGTKGYKDRGVMEPSTQTVVRGPRDGFSETLRTNTTLIRRRIKDPHLWLENMKIGRVTQTDVSIMYIKGIADDDVVEEVRLRLKRINIDGILESGYIEELIQDQTLTPFPTVFHTERPDIIVSALLEGKVAIIVDGTPFVLVVPALFTQFMQAAEDYYQRSDISTLLRMLRYISFLIALLGPALYIAITTFHQELLPPLLLISLVSQREGIPFPAFVEAVMMELTFEILREAGLRMPRAVGQTISIVGAIVIGQAAVDASIVSPAMVIVVSITGISSYVSPAFNMSISIRMVRFAMMGIAAAFGMFGIVIGLLFMVLHLCSLRSFGVPYMAPFAPFGPSGQKDAILRLPWWAMFKRPQLISHQNLIRQQPPKQAKPSPPSSKDIQAENGGKRDGGGGQ